jgi:hypothetical protein
MPNIEGTGYEGRAGVIRSHVKAGMPVELIRDRFNRYDKNAIAVCIRTPKFLGLFGGGLAQIGFVDKERASKMAPKMDTGTVYHAEVLSLYTDMKHPRVTVSWKAGGSEK